MFGRTIAKRRSRIRLFCGIFLKQFQMNSQLAGFSLKIIYIHQYFIVPERMSGGSRSYEMARRLVEWGHSVQIITSDREGGDCTGWHETNESGIQVHWFPVPYTNSMGFWQRLKAFFVFSWVAARKCATLEGDVVFATSTPLTIALPAVWGSKRRNRPLVFEVRDLWPDVPIGVGVLRSKVLICAARWLERFAYRHSRRIVALSPGMKDGVARTGYPARHIEIIPNACDIDLFDTPRSEAEKFRQSHDWLGDRPLVVYAGTFGAVNGVSYLAKLAARVLLCNPEIRFFAVGGGKEFDKVKEAAESLGVLDRNFFVSEKVMKAEVPVIYSAASIVTSLFIDVTELEANSANKFFDGLAAGAPVAINYGGWQAEILEANGAGIRLDAHDMNVAAKQLISHLSNESWMQSAAIASKRLANEQFSRDKLTRKLESCLEECVLENPGVH